MSNLKQDGLSNLYYRVKFLIYGIAYPIWGYIAYSLITHNEPYLERVALGVIFLIYSFFCQKVIQNYGQKLNQIISQFFDALVIVHFYTLIVRASSWGPDEFIAYVFGYIVVMFATGFSTRGIPEMVSWSFFSILAALLIAPIINFMHPMLFLMFIFTIMLFVGVIGTNYAWLLHKSLEGATKKQAILSNMEEGVIVQDSLGEIIEINNTALELLDLTYDELINNKSQYIYYLGDRDTPFSINELFSLDDSGSLSNFLFFQKSNKEKKWIRINKSMFQFRNESCNIFTLSDLTEEVLKDQQLKTQTEIAHHQSKLASIGELAAGVGHEINNPLAIISGQVLLIEKMSQKDRLPSFVYERLDKMKIAISRISSITKGLRSFSRADTSDLKFFDLHDVIYETINLYKEMLLSDGINFEFEIAPRLWIKGNRGRIQQVIVNILNNSKDALLDIENKKITLSAIKDSSQIVIEIKDNGMGISKEIQKKIFEPFFTTKEVNEGTGIGLALVNSIIKEHGGEISLISSPGNGAIFKIKLPLVMERNLNYSDIDQNFYISDKEELKTSEFRALKLDKLNGDILIVDDEKEIRNLLQDIMVDTAQKIYTACSGLEALNILKNNTNIELIISDIKMPNMNGIDFLKKARLELNYKHKFFLITGGVTINTKDVDHLIDGLIYKPIPQESIESIFVN